MVKLDKALAYMVIDTSLCSVCMVLSYVSVCICMCL